MKNRLCAWFLVVCLLLGVMPPGVRAMDVSLSDAEPLTEDNSDTPGETATLHSLYGVATAEIIAKQAISGSTNTIAGEFRHNTDTTNAQKTAAQNYTVTVKQLDSAKQGESDALTWFLDTDGVLTISGSGPMADYSSESPAPWNADRESVGQVVIESGVTAIGNDAFTDCTAMSSVSIPNTVTSIGNFAFLDCYALESVSIPQNVTRIGEQAFYYCGALTSVNVPASVTEIGDGAFSGCANLSAIAVTSGNSAYVSDDGVLFNSAKTRLINYPAGKADATYSIPESVTEIGFGAFEGCENLTSVTIPNGVQWIELQTFTFCENLKSVDIPASVTEIGQYAFQDCAALTDVYYGGTETQWNAVKIGEDNEPLNKATIHYNSGGGTSSDILAQGYCGGEGDGTNLSYVLTQDGTLTISGTGRMATYNDQQSRPPWYERRASITKLVVENGVTSIGAFTFHGCNALTSAVIPESVTLIDTYAFYGCASLNDVTIPSNVTNIGAYAFENCRLSPSVTIPASVVSIGEGVFAHCGELTDVYVSSGNSAYVSENGILFPNQWSKTTAFKAVITFSSFFPVMLKPYERFNYTGKIPVHAQPAVTGEIQFCGGFPKNWF